MKYQLTDGTEYFGLPQELTEDQFEEEQRKAEEATDGNLYWVKVEARTQEEHMESLLGGYTHEELQQAFNAVADPDNWKAPIKATIQGISRESADRIQYAVEFYTATQCQVTKANKDTFRFESVGYRNGPAGP